MNAYVVVILAAVASAQAGFLSAPVTYAGVGQLSSQAGALTTSSQSLRVSQSARPVTYAAAPAYQYAAAPAYQYAAAPVAQYAAAPAYSYAAAPAVRYANVGQVSSQAGSLNSASQSVRISQSARPVTYAAAPAYQFASAPAYQYAAAPVAHYAAAPAYSYAAAPAVRYANVGQVSSQAGSLNSASQSVRVSQSARPLTYAAASPAVYATSYLH